MNLFVSLKSVGKRKNIISKQRLQLTSHPDTLRALLSEVIKLNVHQFHSKETEQPIVSYLTGKEIEEQAVSGKVGFGTIYNNNKTVVSETIKTGIQAFEDGLFLVFLNDEEGKELDAPLTISDGDEVVFIRLTMLAGRMW